MTLKSGDRESLLEDLDTLRMRLRHLREDAYSARNWLRVMKECRSTKEYAPFHAENGGLQDVLDLINYADGDAAQAIEHLDDLAEELQPVDKSDVEPRGCGPHGIEDR